jgi:hypothetical protein
MIRPSSSAPVSCMGRGAGSHVCCARVRPSFVIVFPCRMRAEHPRHTQMRTYGVGWRAARRVGLCLVWEGVERAGRGEEDVDPDSIRTGRLRRSFHGPTAAGVDRSAEARGCGPRWQSALPWRGERGAPTTRGADVGGVLARAWGCSLNPLPGVWCLFYFYAGRRAGYYSSNGIGVAAVGLGGYAGRRARGGPTRREMAKCRACP